MNMAKTHLRGVNDIPSRMSLGNGKCSRAQSANQLSRLEHQKSLLEKQLQVWVKQQVVTEHRLSIVKAQIRSAQQVLKVQKPGRAGKARRKRCRSHQCEAPPRSRIYLLTLKGSNHGR
jgi:hypothetical protein